ncbi:MAG: FAD-dependent thymidylate synthase, partial [Acidimicrobiales bacterium]
ELLPTMTAWFTGCHPKQAGDSDFVYRQSVRAKALDSVRGILPAAALSNLGIYGTGQGYEALLLRMRAHPLPEAASYAAMMLEELRKVVPSFLRRVDMADRGVAWSAYQAGRRHEMTELVGRLLGEVSAVEADRPEVTLVDFDPDAEDKLVAAMLYPYSRLPEHQLLDRVRRLSSEEKAQVVRAYCGERANRRHKPGRALERVGYRFDVLSDYGAFRDLQRHRMLTIEWQDLSPGHGYTIPPAVGDADQAPAFEEAMERSRRLHEALGPDFPVQAGYAVSLAYRVRYVMQFNAREAMHMLELRTGAQGHADYRRVCQEMHRLIAEQAGHKIVADLMTFVDHGSYDLERLDSERRAEVRRTGRP